VPPSRSVRRAAGLLTELAEVPHHELSLSELARRLGVSKSSCQGLLQALVQDGLLKREEGGSYRLGPRLIHLGEAAKDAQQIRSVVAPSLEGLRDRFGVSVIASVQSGDDLVVVAAAEADHPLGMGVRLGQRIPYRAPFGQAWAAWSSPSAIEAWLDRAEQPLTVAQREAFHDSLAMVRRRGFSVTVPKHRPAEAATRSETAEGAAWPTPYASEGRSTESLELPEDHDDNLWTIVGISAPVLDHQQQLACLIGVVQLPFSIRRDEIVEAAEQVTAAAAAAQQRLLGN
jgi:DNA-binding IclR family transcriptional regulator